MIAACASTPQASRERDAEAKKFRPDPTSAGIYVYRPRINTGGDSVLHVDRTLIGSTVPGGFFLVRVDSGAHTLHGIANDQGRLALEVSAGRLYFVRLNVRGGLSRFQQVSEETGKSEILRCCVLFENWDPEQRFFLR